MKEDIQNALTQINSAFGDSLVDTFKKPLKLPYAAYLAPVSVENLKKDSFGIRYFSPSMRLAIIREVKGVTETEALQEVYDAAIELQERLNDKYIFDSEFIIPVQAIHNRDEACYDSILTITERK